MTYNGQAVTGIKHFYLSSGLLLISKTEYWTITSNGVTDIARVDGSRTQTGGVTLPPDMRPGQTVTGSGQTANGSYALSNTLVGFEDVQLAGKTFTNTCHIRVETSLGEKTDVWVAPGYSVIKETSSNGATIQYNGDL
jgi:hypothetical protein